MKSFLQFLLSASRQSSESAMLAAHNRARNKMKRAIELLEEAAEEMADARLAATLLDLRRSHDALNTGKEPLDLPGVSRANPAALDGLLQRIGQNVHQGGNLSPGKVVVEPKINQPLQCRGRVRIVHGD